MIEIENEEIFAREVAFSLARLNLNPEINSFERVRAVNAIAKATVRIQENGAFMDFDPAEDKLLIWSSSNEIYEINADGRCQCKAHMNGHICWHRAAKRLIERYLTAMANEEMKRKALRYRAVERTAERLGI